MPLIELQFRSKVVRIELVIIVQKLSSKPSTERNRNFKTNVGTEKLRNQRRMAVKCTNGNFTRIYKRYSSLFPQHPERYVVVTLERKKGGKNVSGKIKMSFLSLTSEENIHRTRARTPIQYLGQVQADRQKTSPSAL